MPYPTHRRPGVATTGTIARCTCNTRSASAACPQHQSTRYSILDAKHRGECEEAAA